MNEAFRPPAPALAFPWAEPPAIGHPREVAPGVLWLRLRLPYRLDHVNIYLLEDEGGYAAIDTGLGNAETEAAWLALLEGELAGHKLTRLIVTHFHPDHVGLAGFLCSRLGIPLHMPRTEYLFTLALQHAPPDRGATLYRDFYRHHGLPEPVIDGVLSNGHEYLRRTTGVPSIYRRLQQGQEIRIGARVFQILTGGGHASEQAMLYCAHDRLFFSADQVIAQISPNIGVHAMEPEANPLSAYLRSLHRLIDAVPADVLVLPGHGLPFRGLHARAEALIAHHRTRCALIDTACRTRPHAVAELIPVLFPRELDDHQTGFAFAETLAHVNFMLNRSELRHAAPAGEIRRVVV